MTPEQELISALQTIPWFQELDSEYFDKLAGISSVIEIEAGKDLFQQGDKQDYLYVILHGRVAIEIAVPGKGRVRISTCTPLIILPTREAFLILRQDPADG